MTNVSTAEVHDALVNLRTMFLADGYDLRSEAIDDRVSLTVVATPDACAECLVAKELVASMAVDSLRKAGLAVEAEKVDVNYPVTGGAR